VPRAALPSCVFAGLTVPPEIETCQEPPGSGGPGCQGSVRARVILAGVSRAEDIAAWDR
jgi:hypothetical protein